MPRSFPDDDGDTWVGVRDPKKRKQIQDRLAQRARRKRLAEQRSVTPRAAVSTTASAPSNHNAGASRGRSPPVRSSPSSSGTHDAMYMISSPLNIYSALWNNGTLLGLTCGCTAPIFSKDLGPSIPLTLRPTPTQLGTLHPPWIDRFPFPTMRDNFISLLDVIDPEQFLSDIFNIPTFSVEPNEPSWNPRKWRIETEFGKKWGFLFNPKLLEFPS